MKKASLLIILVILAVIGALFFFGEHGGRRVPLAREGEPAPEFSLPSLDGGTVDLASYRGKVVMVHFWATWCPPCVEEIPTLDRLARRFAGTDFRLLAVSVDEGGADAVRAFLKRNELSLQVLLDPDRGTAARYGTFKFPETYIVDRRGILRYKAIGARNWMHPENIKIVQELLDRS